LPLPLEVLVIEISTVTTLLVQKFKISKQIIPPAKE
jgi:hypothetical protein